MACTELVHDEAKKVVDHLREIRLDNIVELPAIIVGGDTSSGKSSLLTAISGLQFPSSAGLTTRCPIEVILTNSKQQSAEVSLQHFDGMTQEQRAFHRTLKNDRSDFGVVITEATGLLTEGKDPSFISPNAIVVKARGPDLGDLTLIDLPGLVAATGEGESIKIIQEIKDMIQRHISSPRAVVLCVVPANNDFHNSAILTMAKDRACDPDGARTVGIITKPDLADKGSEGDVLQLAQNYRARLELGWHTVKLRSQQDLSSKSIAEAEKEEAVFFENGPWRALDRESVGVPKLRERLQELLLKRVHAELPKVLEEAQQRLKSTERELASMGVKCDDVPKKRLVFAAAVDQCYSLLDNARAGHYIGGFFEKSTPEYANNLRACMFQNEIEFRNEVMTARAMCIGDYAVGDKVWYQRMGEKKAAVIKAMQQGKCQVEIEADGSVWNDIDADQLLPRRDELLQLLAAMRGDSLPGFESDVVFKLLVSQKLEPWENPSARLCEQTAQLLQDVASRAVNHTVPAHLPSLRSYLEDKIALAIEGAAEKLKFRVREVLETERTRPYTQNHYYSDILIRSRNQQLTDKLAKLKDHAGKVNYDAMMGILSSFGVGKQSLEESAAVEFEFRLAAYLKVVSKRFIDEVPKLVNTILVLPVVESVKTLMTQVLDTELDEIISETPSAKRKRSELESNAKVLFEAVKVLKRAK